MGGQTWNSVSGRISRNIIGTIDSSSARSVSFSISRTVSRRAEAAREAGYSGAFEASDGGGEKAWAEKSVSESEFET